MLRVVSSLDPELLACQDMLNTSVIFYRAIGWDEATIEGFLIDLLDSTPLWRCKSCSDVDFSYTDDGIEQLCRYCYKQLCLDEIEEFGPEVKPCNEEGKD